MLTKRQQQLFDFILAYHNEHGISPSFDEMRTAMKMKGHVYRLLNCIESRGYIRRLPRLHRAIEITAIIRIKTQKEMNGDSV